MYIWGGLCGTSYPVMAEREADNSNYRENSKQAIATDFSLTYSLPSSSFDTPHLPLWQKGVEEKKQKHQKNLIKVDC